MIAWIGVVFMTVHGLAEAGMIRVASAVGRDDKKSARRAGLTAVLLGSIWLVALAAIPISFPHTLVSIFLPASDSGFNQVFYLVSTLVYLAAFFQIFDGLQVIAALALRGLRDTVTPLVLAFIGYWLFGIVGGWLLAFPLGNGVIGLWWGMAAGLCVTGTLLTVRFIYLARD